MGNETRPSESGKGVGQRLLGVFGLIRDWIKEITALIVTVVAFLNATSIRDIIWPPAPTPKHTDATTTPVSGLEGCLKPKMIVDPQTVPIGKWDSLVLRLTGSNDCAETLGIHVAFKAASDRVRIMSPVSDDCLSLDKPDCWEQTSLDRGVLDQKIIPPRLKLLAPLPLGDPVKLRVNWIIYNVQTKGQLRASSEEIVLRDDP